MVRQGRHAMEVDAVSPKEGEGETVPRAAPAGKHNQPSVAWTGKGPGNSTDSYGWDQNWEPNGYQDQGGQEWWGGCESWGGNADEIDMLQTDKGKGFKGP